MASVAHVQCTGTLPSPEALYSTGAGRAHSCSLSERVSAVQTLALELDVFFTTQVVHWQFMYHTLVFVFWNPFGANFVFWTDVTDQRNNPTGRRLTMEHASI